MNEFIDYTASLSADFITLDGNMKDRLSRYSDMLTEWNEKINLTAITDPKEIAVKHFYDCLLVLKCCDIPQNASLIDVGTGAGFPGVVLKIARPDIKLTLLDGLNKRLVFLNELCAELGLQAETLHMRAEEGGRNPQLRERFDIATARAVARLPVLCEYCMPYVKQGGSFIALKGASADEELSGSWNAIKLLGGEKPKIFRETLPDGDQRAICSVKKISQTPTLYPRIQSKITKKPL